MAHRRDLLCLTLDLNLQSPGSGPLAIASTRCAAWYPTLHPSRGSDCELFQIHCLLGECLFGERQFIPWGRRLGEKSVELPGKSLRIVGVASLHHDRKEFGRDTVRNTLVILEPGNYKNENRPCWRVTAVLDNI